MKFLSTTSWIWVLLFFFHLDLAAQSRQKIDSLKNLLTSAPQDTSRIKIYGELTWLYINPPHLQQDSALQYVDSIRLLSEEINDEKGIAQSQFYLGAIARKEGQHHTALNHFDNFINYHVSTGDSVKVSHGLFQIGNVKARMGNYDQGLSALYRALRINENEGNLSNINYTLNSIGSILRATNRYNEAIEIYERVLQTDSLNSDVLMNLGNVYAEKNQLDKAKRKYKQALKIDRSLENEWAVAYDLENLANLFNKMHLYDSALVNHQQALEIREKLPNKTEEALSLSQLGFTYIKLKNHTLAGDLLTKALAMASASDTKYLVRDIYDKLAILNAEKKSFDDAYAYLRSYTKLKDSLLNEETTKQISEIKVRYETEKKDQQISLLAKEKEVQEKETQRQATIKKASFGGIGLIALLAGLLVYTLYQRLKNQKIVASKNDEVKEANFKRQLTELEMKALQAQINPHFIFNCMNSINQMILESENQKASKYLTKFSKLIRLVLENADEPEVSLKDELSMLEAYIQLEALRFDGEIQYKIEIKEGIDQENTFLPSMVLQPFVENAICHGLMPKKDIGDGLITISIEQHRDQLVCQIEDNGVGREKALELQQKSVWKSKSLGLKITEERLQLLSKELQRQLIRITDLKDALGQALGTRVEVSIPTA